MTLHKRAWRRYLEMSGFLQSEYLTIPTSRYLEYSALNGRNERWKRLGRDSGLYVDVTCW